MAWVCILILLFLLVVYVMLSNSSDKSSEERVVEHFTPPPINVTVSDLAFVDTLGHDWVDSVDKYIKTNDKMTFTSVLPQELENILVLLRNTDK